MSVMRLGYALWRRAAQNQDGSGPFGGPPSDDTNNNENGNGSDDNGYDAYESWWWSPAGMAVRYTFLGILFLGGMIYFVGGYYHAQKRIRMGLRPLRYHAWMVRRHQPYHQYQQPPNRQDGYMINDYQLPPPAYNGYNQAPPAYQPAYQPPAGASKVLADQQSHMPTHRPEEERGESSSVVAPPAARQ